LLDPELLFLDNADDDAKDANEFFSDGVIVPYLSWPVE